MAQFDRFIQRKRKQPSVDDVVLSITRNLRRIKEMEHSIFKVLDTPDILQQESDPNQHLIECTETDFTIALDKMLYTYDIRTRQIVSEIPSMGTITQVYRPNSTAMAHMVEGNGLACFLLNRTAYFDVSPIIGGGWQNDHVFTTVSLGTPVVHVYDDRQGLPVSLGTLQIKTASHSVFCENDQILAASRNYLALFDVRMAMAPCVEHKMDDVPASCKMAIHPTTKQVALLLQSKVCVYSKSLQLEDVFPLPTPGLQVVWVGNTVVVNLKTQLYICTKHPSTLGLADACTYVVAWPAHGVILLSQMQECLKMMKIPGLFSKNKRHCSASSVLNPFMYIR